MSDPLDKLFDPAEVAPRWARTEPAPPPATTPPPPPPAPAAAHDVLAELSTAALALEVPDRARKALAILLGQIAAKVAVIEPATPPPASSPPPDLAGVRAELAGLLDLLEDHLEALVLYRPRSP